MKFILFSLLVTFGISCNDNDQEVVTEDCQNTDILGLGFDPNFLSNISLSNPLFGYMDNSSSSSNLVPISTVDIKATPSSTYLQMSGANNAVYKASTDEYKLVIPEEKRLVTISNTGVVTHTPILNVSSPANIVNAPVYLNNNLYFGKIDKYFYDTSHNLTFEILDSNFNVLSSIVIPSGNRSGYEVCTSNFTSATNNVDSLYFVVNNNLIIYKPGTNSITASMITGNTITNGSIIGLEYKENNILYAIYEDWTYSGHSGNNSKLVELNISNPSLITKSDVIDLGFEVNPEIFSTTYNECNKKYYVSTVNFILGSFVVKTIRVDLSGSPTLVPLTPSIKWIAGMTLKK